MKIHEFVDAFDADITLRDAGTDLANRPSRRAIANLCIGMGLDDAYYSVRELHQAAQWTHEGERLGPPKLREILSNDAVDDFQRCIYFALAGRGICEMLEDLEWLEELLKHRAYAAGDMHRRGVRRVPLINPYVAAEPDGPVVSRDAAFDGPSWWMDPRSLA